MTSRFYKKNMCCKTLKLIYLPYCGPQITVAHTRKICQCPQSRTAISESINRLYFSCTKVWRKTNLTYLIFGVYLGPCPSQTGCTSWLDVQVLRMKHWQFVISTYFPRGHMEERPCRICSVDPSTLLTLTFQKRTTLVRLIIALQIRNEQRLYNYCDERDMC